MPQCAGEVSMRPEKVAGGEAGPIDERPGKLKRHRSIGRHPHPKAKTARAHPRAVFEIAVGQRHHNRVARNLPYDLTPRLTAVVQFTAHPLFTPKHHSTSL